MDFYQNQTYEQAVAAVIADPSISYSLRARLEQDQLRDPVDARSDAELLLVLSVKRENEVFEKNAARLPLSSISGDSLPSLNTSFVPGDWHSLS